MSHNITIGELGSALADSILERLEEVGGRKIVANITLEPNRVVKAMAMSFAETVTDLEETLRRVENERDSNQEYSDRITRANRHFKEERDKFARVNTGLIDVNVNLIASQKSLVETNDYLTENCRRLDEEAKKQHKIIVAQKAELEGRF